MPPRTVDFGTANFIMRVTKEWHYFDSIVIVMNGYARLDQKSVFVYGCYSNFMGELQYCTPCVDK
jgi:hypothetical protein